MKSFIPGGVKNCVNCQFSGAIGSFNCVNNICSYVIGNNITTTRTNTTFANNLSSATLSAGNGFTGVHCGMCIISGIIVGAS